MLKPGDRGGCDFSNQGLTIDLLRTVELPGRAGADIVASSASGSPLAKLCTVALFADVRRPDVYSPMTSRMNWCS